MPRPESSPDRSSAVAFAVFTVAAGGWIAVMAMQPNIASREAPAIVVSKDIAIALTPPHFTEIAGLAR